jgi:hypothetical protein
MEPVPTGVCVGRGHTNGGPAGDVPALPLSALFGFRYRHCWPVEGEGFRLESVFAVTPRPLPVKGMAIEPCYFQCWTGLYKQWVLVGGFIPCWGAG